MKAHLDVSLRETVRPTGFSFMASYHLTTKVGGKGKGAAHAAYIAREGKYSKGDKYEDLQTVEHGNMPTWAQAKPLNFWKAADEYERVNGSVYREIEIALPRELKPEQRLALVREFVRNEIGENHAYTFALHTPKAALDGGEQPHAHIMFSERKLDGIERSKEQFFKRYNTAAPHKGGAKKDNTGKDPATRRTELIALRERWAKTQNKHLAAHGHESRVDARSYAEQGRKWQTEKHLGGKGVRQLHPEKRDELLAFRDARRERVHEIVFLQAYAGDLKEPEKSKRSRAEPERDAGMER